MATPATQPQLANLGRFSLDLTRTFDAPRELVFKVWTDPAHVAKWWGPHHFTVPHCELDVRPGGAILIHMQGPDGTVFPMAGEFEEVTPPEKLVLIQTVNLDENGETGFAVRTSVTFAEASGKTQLTIQARVIRATPESEGPLSGQAQGWAEQMERLGTYLSGVTK